MAEPYSSAVGNRPPPVKSGPFGKSRTRQSDKKDADINVIVARYDKTGIIPVSKRQAFYADVSTIGDYRSVLDRVAEASEFFMQQPAELRKQFENDPAKFLDFVSNADQQQLRDMGLLELEGEEPPVEEPPVKPAAGGVPPVAEEPEIPAPQ